MTQLSAPAARRSAHGARGGETAGHQPGEGSRSGAPIPAGAGTATAPSIDASVRGERAFLAMCLAEPGLGRGYLERLGDDHLSSPALRRVRRHLAAHLEAPLSGLSDADPALAAGVAEIAMLADEEPASEPALRLGYLQLDLRRIERALRAARERSDFGRLRELWKAREEVRDEVAALMGEAV